ncbi:MAG TPA: FHA domain-containing protein [Ktedonobacterales bacterium]|nr:FHA domain-containing protein [Ktedonobacterales bacterium]
MTLPIGALTPQFVTAVALSSNGTLLVAAAGVVVVLAILLVFVMVLRSNGAAKRTANGLGYDPQQGPLGQPSAGRGGARQGGRAPQQADAGYGYDDRYDDGYDNNYGGRPSAARGGAGQGAPQEAWGAQATPSQARWNDPAAQQRMAAPAAQAPQWGAPDAGVGGPMGGAQGAPSGAPWGAQDDNPWGAGADAWGGRPAAPSRPGGNPFTGASGGNMGQMSGPAGQPAWDAPAPQSQGRNPWGAQGNGWDQQDGMGAQGQPVSQDWGAPVAPASQPPARNGRDPYGGSPDQWGDPMAPAGPQGWNQPAPPASPSQPGYGPRSGGSGIGYGDADKTRIARPPAAPSRIGALIERQGKDPGHVFELRNERTTIGRSRDSDIFLEDLAVSRLHATINRDPAGRYLFRDEQSANGVFVNGEKVTERQLEEGDEVQIGQTMLVFQRK